MEYNIGSTLLGLSNARDKDKLVITKEVTYKRVIENGKDIVYISPTHLEGLLKFENAEGKRERLMLYNYQLDEAIIGQGFPYKYHILDYRMELLELLTRTILEGKMNFNKRVMTENGCCCKAIYHIAYNIFILQNNSPYITREQKAIIQQIHDLNMPIDYLDELLNILMEVLNNE